MFPKKPSPFEKQDPTDKPALPMKKKAPGKKQDKLAIALKGLKAAQ